MLWSMGSQRVRQDWMTELNWTGEFGQEWIHVYVWLSPFAVHPKLILSISYTPIQSKKLNKINKWKINRISVLLTEGLEQCWTHWVPNKGLPNKQMNYNQYPITSQAYAYSEHDWNTLHIHSKVHYQNIQVRIIQPWLQRVPHGKTTEVLSTKKSLRSSDLAGKKYALDKVIKQSKAMNTYHYLLKLPSKPHAFYFLLKTGL